MKSNLQGMRHYEQKRYAKASASFVRALEVFPTNPIPTFNLACAYALQNERAKSVEILRRYTRLNSEWKSKVVGDHDFDAIRNSREYRELVDANDAR